jgi:hypothetical protein
MIRSFSTPVATMIANRGGHKIGSALLLHQSREPPNNRHPRTYRGRPETRLEVTGCKKKPTKQDVDNPGIDSGARRRR